MFIQLTHYYSGNKILIRADLIHTIRPIEDGKTLVIAVNGSYVVEDVYLIKDMIESVVSIMDTTSANSTIEQIRKEIDREEMLSYG